MIIIGKRKMWRAPFGWKRRVSKGLQLKVKKKKRWKGKKVKTGKHDTGQKVLKMSQLGHPSLYVRRTHRN